MLLMSSVKEPLTPEETVVEESEQEVVSDEFEIRRKAFFRA